MKYNLIIFDLGNVVVKFDHNISAAKIARRFGLNKRYIYDLFFDSKLTCLHDEGKLSPREFYHKFKQLLNIAINFKEFKDIWNNIFFLNPAVVRFIKKIKRKHKVYLMSNINKLHFDFLKNKFGIHKNFDKVILSFEVGERKPHPKIYKHALKLARTTPRKTIFIDDRPELVEGAEKLGIKSIQFQNIGQLKKELARLL